MLILLVLVGVYFLIGWGSFTLQMREIDLQIEYAARGLHTEQQTKEFDDLKPRLN